MLRKTKKKVRIRKIILWLIRTKKVRIRTYVNSEIRHPCAGSVSCSHESWFQFQWYKSEFNKSYSRSFWLTSYEGDVWSCDPLQNVIVGVPGSLAYQPALPQRKSSAPVWDQTSQPHQDLETNPSPRRRRYNSMLSYTFEGYLSLFALFRVKEKNPLGRPWSLRNCRRVWLLKSEHTY